MLLKRISFSSFGDVWIERDECYVPVRVHLYFGCLTGLFTSRSMLVHGVYRTHTLLFLLHQKPRILMTFAAPKTQQQDELRSRILQEIKR